MLLPYHTSPSSSILILFSQQNSIYNYWTATSFQGFLLLLDYLFVSKIIYILYYYITLSGSTYLRPLNILAHWFSTQLSPVIGLVSCPEETVGYCTYYACTTHNIIRFYNNLRHPSSWLIYPPPPPLPPNDYSDWLSKQWFVRIHENNPTCRSLYNCHKTNCEQLYSARCALLPLRYLLLLISYFFNLLSFLDRN